MKNLKLSKVDTIVIHCSDTPINMDIGAEEIREWHLARGWDDIGYHFIIRTCGRLEYGRLIQFEGAHVRGHNDHTIAVCLVGGKGMRGVWYTPSQEDALVSLVEHLRTVIPSIKHVCGHYEFDTKKTCPNFDARAHFCVPHYDVE